MLKILLSLFFMFLLLSCQRTDEDFKLSRENYYEGNKYYDAGNFKEAIKYYDLSIEHNPKYDPAYLKRGDSKRKLRDIKGAIEDYNQAVKINSINSRAWYHMGTLKIIMGNKREGCEDIAEAKKLCYMPAEKYYADNCQ